MSYTIDAGDLGDTLYFAAHAVVQEVEYITPTVEEVALELPSTVTFTPTHPGGGDSYWDVTVHGSSALAGTYDAWCVDTSRTLGSGGTYTAEVVYSLDDLSGLVDYPENFDQVNWIINQDFVGQSSPSGGTYTYGDVQKAIWTLVEDNPNSGGLGSWSQARVNEILAGAASDGLGYEPGCLDQVAVLLVPVDGSGNINRQVIIGQVTFIDIDLECDYDVIGEETAWASGDLAFKQSWASYWSCDQH